MEGVPRNVFDRAVEECGSDRYSKRFDSWSQLTSMIYGQLSGASSLRMIEASYNSQSHHHYHLGTGPVRRSTLADANSKRSVKPFAEIAKALMAQVPRAVRRDHKDMLYLLDSTSITLKGRHFDDWTAANRTQHTQGIKLHVLYDLGAQAPVHSTFTAANINDVTEAASLAIEAGAMYVFDKGYCNYNWWAGIAAKGAWFVTRFKSNAAVKVVESRAVPDDASDIILADEIVRFSNPCPGAKRRNHYTEPLRRITVARADKPTPLVIATNDMHSSAATVAQRYKDRWNIELFFKWIKQHLKIRETFGCSENAVKVQILCALISMLLLALYRQANKLNGSLWMVLAELRPTLFQRSAHATQAQRRYDQNYRERLDLKRQQLAFSI
jgi:IS4 transposase